MFCKLMGNYIISHMNLLMLFEEESLFQSDIMIFRSERLF